MNKKLIGNLILLGLVVGLGLSFSDMGKKERSNEELISIFIEDNLQQGTEYQALSFEEVTEQFLLGKKTISEPMQEIKDSINTQLDILDEYHGSLSIQNVLQKARTSLSVLSLETVSDYLNIDAEIKRVLKKAGGLSKGAKEELYQEETRMLQAFNELNTALGQYNLSAFSIDFGQTKSVRYFHHYRLSDAFGNSQQSAVFELDLETKEVISFQEIG